MSALYGTSRLPKSAVVAACVLLACSGDGGEPALFPDDYASTYQEVRACRFSLEHDLVYMRVLAAPDAVAAYTGRTVPFPPDAIVLKEQYGDSDTACAGPLVDITAMQKLAAGSSPATLDWRWQKTDASHRVVETDVSGCTGCHAQCGQPPDGYDGTCTVP